MRTFFIPVELCEYVLRNKLSKPFKLYLLLKASCDGKIKIASKDFSALATSLGYVSSRSVRNNLKHLLRLNFVGYNPKSGFYFIRGFDRLNEAFKIQTRTTAECDIRDIDKVQSFCMGAVCGYIVKDQRKRRWLLERKKGRSNPGGLPTHFDLANDILVKKLKLSLNTVYRLKQAAHHDGFIDIQKKFRPLYVQASQSRLYKKANPEIAHRVVVREGMLYLQMPDQIQSRIRFRSGKKIETFKKGI